MDVRISETLGAQSMTPQDEQMLEEVQQAMARIIVKHHDLGMKDDRTIMVALNAMVRLMIQVCPEGQLDEMRRVCTNIVDANFDICERMMLTGKGFDEAANMMGEEYTQSKKPVN